MSKIKVSKNTTFIQEFELDTKQVYIFGRGENCQVKLDPEPGISRQHFQVAMIDNKWTLEVLSRYGELYLNGDKVPGFELVSGRKFSVPPYEFEFSDGSPNTKTMEISTSSERTYIAVVQSSVFLNLIDHSGAIKKIFRLEGEKWLAGRDITCSLYIENPKVSRKQFEMHRDGSNYFIRDLGSANGTQVNGHQLSTTDWTKLQSGDIISIVDWTMQFEIRDSNFQEKISKIDEALKQPFVGRSVESNDESAAAEATQYGPIPAGYQESFEQNQQFQQNQWGQNEEQQAFGIPSPMPPPSSNFGDSSYAETGGLKAKWIIFKSKMNPVRWIILIIIIFSLGFGIYDSLFSGKDAKKNTENKNGKTPFDLLSAEDQLFVQQSYNAAEQLYFQKRYQLALQEILRMKEKIPVYKDSASIEAGSMNGIEMESAARKELQIAKEKEEMEEKIKEQVQYCRTKMNRKTVTIEDIDICLATVLSLNPNHPSIEELKREVSQIISDRNIKKVNREQYLSEVKKLKELYQIAISFDEKNKYRDAIKQYDRVISSALPDPEKLKSKSSKRREELANKLILAQSEFEQKGDQFFKDGKYKEAVTEFQKSLEINPENEVIKGKLSSSLLELKKIMQNIFQESIIEESVGDVDAAKAKWKKIMEQSLPQEEYYDKARLKLKKYGVL